MTSTDIGIAQASTETLEIHTVGWRNKICDFTWTAAVSTFGNN
jgi:hypothetical protein